MPTNDFLEIATAGGANVETQVAYAADADRTSFFPDGGVPDANQHGKMFRQSSVIAHMIAQAICDITGSDMLDDGNAATQLANFKNMLLLAAGNLGYFVPGGTINALTIAPGGPAAYKAGENYYLQSIGANTVTGVTFKRDALAAKPVVYNNNSVLDVGVIPAVGLIQLVYDAGLDKFILTTPRVSKSATFTNLVAGAGNYNPPAGCTRIRIRMVAGGGGGGAGAGGGVVPEVGSAGTASSFNGIVANPGQGGGSSVIVNGAANGGYGGSAGAGAASFRSNGGGGDRGTFCTSANVAGGSGAVGGTSVLGGGGRGGLGGVDVVAPGYGGGGSGGNAGNDDGWTGGGGGAGEYVEINIANPVGPYAYAVGGGGAGGPNLGPGTVFAGQNGTGGAILIDEFYS